MLADLIVGGMHGVTLLAATCGALIPFLAYIIPGIAWEGHVCGWVGGWGGRGFSRVACRSYLKRMTGIVVRAPQKGFG